STVRSGPQRKIPYDGGHDPNFGFSELVLDGGVEAALLSRTVPPRQEGRLAIVTNAGRDAVDALAPLTNGARGGRRSRVVLTPRRWRQVCGDNPASDGGKKARS